MGCPYLFSSTNKHCYERANHVSYSSHPTHLLHSSLHSISGSDSRHVVYSCLRHNYFFFSLETGDFSQQLLCCVICEYATMTTYRSVRWVLLVKQFKDSSKMLFILPTLLFLPSQDSSLHEAFLSRTWLLHISLLENCSCAFEVSVAALFLYRFRCQVNSIQSKLSVSAGQLAQQLTKACRSVTRWQLYSCFPTQKQQNQYACSR